MEKTIHVLSVGSVDRGCMVHDTLLKGPKFRLSIATDYRALWAIPKQEPIQVVILHNTLSAIDLEDSCRFIRRRWPDAWILLIRTGEGSLDDALYDDRVLPAVAQEVLLSAIERHAGMWASKGLETTKYSVVFQR
jgi:hypothetical protein